MKKIYEKNIKKINILLLVLLVCTALLCVFTAYKAYADTRLTRELRALESERLEYENLEKENRNIAQDYISRAEVFEKKKLDIEPKIRAKRSEILGKK